MTIDELYNKNELSLRTCNSCKKNKINTLDKILNYYNNFNTFIFLKNISDQNNFELLNFCEKYFENNNIDINEYNNKISFIYNELTIDEKKLFQEHFNDVINRLSFKSKLFLENNNIDFNVENISKYLFNKNIFREQIESKKVLMEIFELKLSMKIYLTSNIS
jgi:hypothetical protein